MGKPIIYNGANSKLLTKGILLDGDGSTYARGLLPTYVAASTTAVAFSSYQCNTTSAAFTMTLPTGVAGYVIRFTDDAGTWATNNLTIAPAASQTIQGISSSGSLVCNLSGAWVELAWDSTNSYWVVAASGFQYGPTYSPGVTGGILPSAGLPGATSGTAIPAGTVGQTVSSGQLTGNSATGSVTALGSISLTAGVWVMFATATSVASATNCAVIMAITSTSASFTGATSGVNQADYCTNSAGYGAGFVVANVNLAATTSYYLNVQSTPSAVSISASLFAVRIA